jgi:hypothetical protein
VKFLKNRTAEPGSQPESGPTEMVDGVPAGLVSLVKTAAVSLQKSGLSGHRAAVYLVLDHSGSMYQFYADGSVQRLAEQTLALSANLDDDGTVPLVYFGTDAATPIDVRVDNYAGVVGLTHPNVPWGSTDYVRAMNAVIAEHTVSGATSPALVIFQTDGEPDSRPATEAALRRAATLPVFWAFVGFGSNIEFLEKLDTLTGRTVDNASFFHAANPRTVSDAALYDGIVGEYAAWLTAAQAAGIVL